MRVLIVHAHPEPKSFTGAMKETAIRVLSEAGHEVMVSDLYAMKWKAVADEQDFRQRSDRAFFKYQLEQARAQEQGALAPDILAEQEKLLWCDALVMEFPLWWFSLPAILKGWVDRVFTMGFAYGGGRWYDRGGLAGRRAMLALTTGGSQTIFSPRGLNGDIEQILFPINHGILYFVGFDVLPPFIAWAPARVGEEQRRQYLAEYRERLLAMETAAPIPYPKLADYDETFQRKMGEPEGGSE